jgi:effector-binding domain-containing protein
MSYRVALTELASTTAAHVRVRATAAGVGDAVARGVRALHDFAARAGATPTGPPQVGYPGGGPGEESDLDVYLPISATPPARDGIGVVVVPGGPAAQAFHRGRYDTIGAGHAAVARWVHAHGYRRAGPVREVYLTGPDEAGPDDLLTEIVMPLAKDGPPNP